MLDTTDRFRGALVGLAVGEAIGVRIAGGSDTSEVPAGREAALRWSGGTAQALWVARAVLGVDPRREVDPDALGRSLARALLTWHRDPAMTSKSPESVTRGAAERILLGVPWNRAGVGREQHPVVALRGVSLGLQFAPSDVAVPARVASCITHRDGGCLEATTFVAWMTGRLVRGATLDERLVDDASEMIANLGVSRPVAVALTDAVADAWFDDVDSADVFPSEADGAAEEGVRQAIVAALHGRQGRDGFVAAVELAARVPAHGAIIAGLAGALLGASRGMRAIPVALVAGVESLDLLVRLADALRASASRSSQLHQLAS